MKLACLRCKRKKVKCDKGEPVCHQCITAKEECQYVERRQRPRHAQQKVAVRDLSQRLEQLEKHISSTGDDRSSSALTLLPRREGARSSTPVPSPEASLTVADGRDTWVYQLATDTRRGFQDQATPVSTPTPRIDNAMILLNEALDDLGRLRVRTEALNVDFDLSPVEARACIDAFPDILNSMVVPDIFPHTLINSKLLRALPDIIDSPYISIDPGMRVMYYNALYYGLQQVRGPGDPLATKAYIKVLESVPAWLEASDETSMDGHAAALTAALTAWTAINNHDYQMSWKFHCKSCQYLKASGIDQVDVLPAKNFEEESQRDNYRYLYWQIISTDTLFRMFYGKPTVVRWIPGKVRPPLMFNSNNMHPSASQVIISVVWIRYTHLSVEMLNLIDSYTPNSHDGSLARKVDECCVRLEELIVEWRLEALMSADDTALNYRCLLADHIMNIYTVIIGMQRLVSKTRPAEITLRAARRVANILFHFHTDPTLSEKSKCITNHFITFYPFCVVFTLYSHVLACTNPDDCESDIQALENIGIAMSETSTERQDFVPFAKTINALNRVSRTLQDERRKAVGLAGTGCPEFSAMQEPSLPSSSYDTFQDLVATELPDFDMSAFSLPDYPASVDGDFQPLGFFRALENDFVARNWQPDWWDLSGGVGESIADIPGSGEMRYNAPHT